MNPKTKHDSSHPAPAEPEAADDAVTAPEPELEHEAPKPKRAPKFPAGWLTGVTHVSQYDAPYPCDGCGEPFSGNDLSVMAELISDKRKRERLTTSRRLMPGRLQACSPACAKHLNEAVLT